MAVTGRRSEYVASYINVILRIGRSRHCWGVLTYCQVKVGGGTIQEKAEDVGELVHNQWISTEHNVERWLTYLGIYWESLYPYLSPISIFPAPPLHHH